MSDYSFLKSGFSTLIEPVKITEKEKENIEIMLGLFTSNALINASKYVKICNRNSITKTDIAYGLKYEVFEFINREDINQGLEEIRKDYENLKLEDYELDDEDFDSEEDENIQLENHSEKHTNTGLEDYIIPDSEVQPFNRIEESQVDIDNKEFVTKFHNYTDTWNEWIPQTHLEEILKNAINKIN